MLYTQRYVDSDLQNNVTALKLVVVGGMDKAPFNCTELNIAQRFDNVDFWRVRFFSENDFIARP